MHAVRALAAPLRPRRRESTGASCARAARASASRARAALGAESALVDSNLRLLAADGLIALDGQGRFRIADRAAFERRLAFVELKDRFEP